ncbi:MAG: ATP-binding protein [Polyangiaceae bacterium]
MGDSHVSQLDLWGLRLFQYACERDVVRSHPLGGEWQRRLGLKARDELGLENRAVQKAVKRALRERNDAIETAPPVRREVVFENAERLGAVVGLSSFERELLALAVLCHRSELLRQTFQHVDTARPVALVAAMLGKKREDVEAAFGRGGVFGSTGLVRLGECEHYNHREPFRVADNVADALSREHESTAALVGSFVRRAKPAVRSTRDFDHLTADLEVIEGVLRAAHESHEKGVNVLLYGRPGTGKTELARALVEGMGAELYEVAAQDGEGDAIGRHGRLSAYQLAQRVLSRSPRAVVLFDELEDVFPESGSRMEDASKKSGVEKAFIVRLLEENKVPAIWIGNRVDQVDPAFLRRFDYALELKSPPTRVRRRLLVEGGLDLGLGEAWIERLALDERMTPADIARALRVTRMVRAAPGAQAESIIGRVLDRSVSLGRPRAMQKSSPAGGRFDLKWLCASEDLSRVVDGMARRRAGTICLFGPPGTGKTAFAHHLATALDQPLLARRASDLLSPWVGETEANLAEMFRSARAEGAMVLLDEADSFFRTRTGAEHSWEVTQVNELLTQMDSYDGVFVCTTNLVDTLDEAAMRRFALKIRFDPLAEPERWDLFKETLAASGTAMPGPTVEANLRDRLARQSALTPGDFAVAVRRAELLGDALTPERLVTLLGQEQERKRGSSRAIGFGVTAAR